MSTLRFDVGFDYFNYYKIIYRIGGAEYGNEPISKLLMDCGYYFKYPPLSFALFAIITYGLVIYVFYRYSQNFGISLFVYLCLFFLESLGAIRQSLAEAIVLLGYPFVVNKKFWKFFLIILIATLAHKSALVGLAIYPLYNYFNIKRLVFCILVIYVFLSSIIDSFVGSGLFGSAANHIAAQDEYGGGGILMYVMPALSITIWILCKVKRLNIYLNYFPVIFLGLSIPFFIGAHFGMRISKYFAVYLCFLIPQVLTQIRPYIRLLCLTAGIAYFMMFIYVGWNKKRPTIAPYQTIFEIENTSEPHFKLP